MKIAIKEKNLEEYGLIAGLVAILFFCAVLAVFVQSDPVIIAVTTGLLGLFMWYVGEIKPIHLLYALCFGVSFLPYINLNMFPLSAVYVIAFLFTGLSFISLYRNENKLKFPAPAIWMTLFLLIGAATFLIAPDKKQVVVNSGQFFVYLLIYITIANVVTRKVQIVRCLKYILLGSIIPLAVSFLQFVISFQSLQKVVDIFYQSVWGKLIVGVNGLERLGGRAIVLLNRGSNIGASDAVLFRVFGTLEAPTAFGRYVLLVAIVAGALYLLQRNKKKVVLGGEKIKILFALLGICLILTWTRSAWLSFFVAAAFIIVYRRENSVEVFTLKNIKILFFVLFIPAVVLFIFYLMGISLATEVVTSIFALDGLGASAVGRLLTILFALNYIVHHPLVGIGFGNYAYAQPGVDAIGSTATFATAHNRYLLIGVELGIPGLIVFLLILYTLVKQPLKLIKAPFNSFYHTLGIMFLGVWIAFLVGSNFAGSIIHPKIMTLVWLLAGIQTAAYNVYLNDKVKEHTVYRLEVAH